VEKLYSAKEIERLFGFKARRIRYWHKIGFLTPSVNIGTRKYYIPQDLMGLRTAKGLLDAGLSFAKVKRSVIDIKRVCPEVMRRHSGLFIPREEKERAIPFNPRRQPLVGFSQWGLERGIKSAHMGFTGDVRPQAEESRTSRQNRPGRRGPSKSKRK